MDHKSALEFVLSQHSLVCGAVLREDGEVLHQAGDFSAMAWAPSLLNATSFVLLDGAIRPAMLGEGREFALLERAGPWLVIVFGLDRAEGMEHILFARRVGATIMQTFAAN